ncbi:hypothetical protein DKP78_21375, partial [Enterococcus faecium]
PLHDVILARLRSLHLTDSVTVQPYADMSEIFSRSSIFVSLQRTENYPSQSLLEAMAARNAVVATRVGETAKLVRHQETGLLVTSDP